MIRVCHWLPAVLAVSALAKEQQRSPYDSQRPMSASDAARRFDLTNEGLFYLRTIVCALSEDDAKSSLMLMCRRRSHNEQRCYEQQQFTNIEVEMLKAIDEQLRNGEIARVKSRDPSTLTQTDREMFRERIYNAITRIAPNEHMARVMRQKLENFVRCMTVSNRRTYPGGQDQRE